MLCEGNAARYGFETIEPLPGNPLEGKKICVLGSSVVYGSASREQAVAEYLGKRFACAFTKEAVCGTTLTDNGPRSYVSRLQRLDPNEAYALFLCQLSTNDATGGLPLGEVCETGDPDTATVTGAMEFIIACARDTWRCPVAFFTGARFSNERYGAMVERLYALKRKYGIGVLDLWSGEAFNTLTPAQRALYMHDPIHPTRAGYRDWWGPELERQLLEWLTERNDK